MCACDFLISYFFFNNPPPQKKKKKKKKRKKSSQIIRFAKAGPTLQLQILSASLVFAYSISIHVNPKPSRPQKEPTPLMPLPTRPPTDRMILTKLGGKDCPAGKDARPSSAVPQFNHVTTSQPYNSFIIGQES